MNFLNEFVLLLKARYPIIYISTNEEERIEYLIKYCAKKYVVRTYYSCDFVDGYQGNPNDKGFAARNPLEALDLIDKLTPETASLFILKDYDNFLKDFSIEVTPKAASKIENFSDYLPAKTLIYIAHIEGTPIDDMVQTAKKITDQGFSAMPHFPARIIKNKNVLGEWITRYQNEAGVENALLIAGGSNKPYGEYDSSINLIESELFDRANFKRLHIAGHPEGS